MVDRISDRKSEGISDKRHVKSHERVKEEVIENRSKRMQESVGGQHTVSDVSRSSWSFPRSSMS